MEGQTSSLFPVVVSVLLSHICVQLSVASWLKVVLLSLLQY